jgi:hypothetical protein
MITSSSTDSLKGAAFLSKMLGILSRKTGAYAPRGVGCSCKRAFTVRREKVLVHSGMEDPPGNWIAPPGSNRSGGGGNKAAGASGVEGRIRRLGESAGGNVSER